MRPLTLWNSSDHSTPASIGATPIRLTRRDLREERRRQRSRRSRTIVLGCAAAALVVGGGGVAVSAATGTPAFGFAASISPHAAATAGAGASRGDSSATAGSSVSKQVANSEAAMAIATGQQVVAEARGKANARALTISLASLSGYQKLDPDTVVARVATTRHVAATVDAATTVAEQRIAREKAAAVTKAAAEAQAEAARVKQAADNTVAGAKATARSLMASEYGWGDAQFTCLSSLWTKESGWSYAAYNANGGATGIPQALPGDKMASVASDWRTNATTQIIWGLQYISGSYGTPCAAWAHSEANNWY